MELPLEDVLNQGLGGGKVELEDEHTTSAESNNDCDSQEEFVTPPLTPAKKQGKFKYAFYYISFYFILRVNLFFFTN